MLPLLVLVCEVHTQVRRGGFVGVTAQPDVAVTKQHHVRRGRYDKEVHSDIKFASIQQQRIGDVPAGSEKVSYVYTYIY